MTWLPLALLLLGANPSKTELFVRVFPPVSIAQPFRGCAEVLLTSEIKGPEREDWYCPKVTWELPDGTRASEESDCDPYAERTEFPRRWTRRVCLAPHPKGEAWEVNVILSKGTKPIAKAGVRILVK